MTLSAVRKSIHPIVGDTWETIASRELSDQADAVSQLQSWNLHVFMRPGGGNPAEAGILPSDIIFLEPPQALTETPQALTETPQALTETPQALTETPQALEPS